MARAEDSIWPNPSKVFFLHSPTIPGELSMCIRHELEATPQSDCSLGGQLDRSPLRSLKPEESQSPAGFLTTSD